MGKVSEYVEATRKIESITTRAEAKKPKPFYLKDNPNTWHASFDAHGFLHLSTSISPLCLEDAQRFMMWLSENL